MKEKIIKNRKLIDSFIIILVACFLSLPLLKSNLDVYYDDGIQHIARAYGTLESIKENGIFHNIISSFSNGFGYPHPAFVRRFIFERKRKPFLSKKKKMEPWHPDV